MRAIRATVLIVTLFSGIKALRIMLLRYVNRFTIFLLFIINRIFDFSRDFSVLRKIFTFKILIFQKAPPG